MMMMMTTTTLRSMLSQTGRSVYIPSPRSTGVAADSYCGAISRSAGSTLQYIVAGDLGITAAEVKEEVISTTSYMAISTRQMLLGLTMGCNRNESQLNTLEEWLQTHLDEHHVDGNAQMPMALKLSGCNERRVKIEGVSSCMNSTTARPVARGDNQTIRLLT
jgi:hypothetical protein